MPKHQMVILTVEENPQLTLDELCHACAASPEWIQEIIEYGAIEPQGISIETWRFNAEHLRKIKIMTHLRHDLEVNLPGVVLAIDLMDEMEKMRAKLELFEKMYK